MLADYVAMTRTELAIIDADTTSDGFADRLRWNAAYWRLARGM
jgi:L-arabinose isomerase